MADRVHVIAFLMAGLALLTLTPCPVGHRST